MDKNRENQNTVSDNLLFEKYRETYIWQRFLQRNLSIAAWNMTICTRLRAWR
jgi:hypothetical protein